MRTLLFGLNVVALAATLAIAQAEALPSRTALVIGNADYSFAPLRNPINDAEAVAKSLEQAGFNVIVETDADHDELEQAIEKLGDELKIEGRRRSVLFLRPWRADRRRKLSHSRPAMRLLISTTSRLSR